MEQTSGTNMDSMKNSVGDELSKDVNKVADNIKDAVGDATQSGAHLTEQAKQMAQQAQQKAGEAMGQVGTQIKTRVDEQKNMAAQTLVSVSNAVRQAGQHLRESQNVPVADQAENLARTIDNIGNYLRDADVEEVVGQVKTYAQNHPAIFIGSAFTLGFLLARFVKSSGKAAAMGASDSMGTGSGMGNSDPLLPVPISTTTTTDSGAPLTTDATELYPDADVTTSTYTTGGTSRYGDNTSSL